MPVGHQHKVTAVVWKRIQHQERPLPAFQDPAYLLRSLPRHAMLDRVVRRGQQITKDTSMIARPCCQGLRHTSPRAFSLTCHIGIAPWSPQPIHEHEYKCRAAKARSSETAFLRVPQHNPPFLSPYDI